MNRPFPLRGRGSNEGFSVIELLALIMVMTFILVMVTPSLEQALRIRSEGSAVASLRGALERARSRAIAGNRWIWVAIKPDAKGILISSLGSRDGSRNPVSSDEIVALGRESLLEGVSLSVIAQFSSAPRPPADRVMPESGGWIIFSPDGEARFGEDPNLDPPPPPGALLLRWIEVGVKGRNPERPGVAAQVAGLTGQVHLFQPQP